VSSQLDFFSSDQPPADAPDEATDCGWLLRLLWDGEPRTLNEILRASFDQRGCGLTVHSRASDLRRRHGYTIVQEKVSGAKRGASSSYRLVR
jgi:hypothetical protein